MTEIEIKDLFIKAISARGIHNKLEVSRDVVYNWRNRPNLAADLGRMLEVLLKLDLINIQKKE